MTKTFSQLSFVCKDDHVEQYCDYLSAFDALAVTAVDGSGHQEIFQITPNEAPLWKNTKVVALFYDEEEAMQAANMVDNIGLEKVKFTIETIEDQDWVRETQKSFPATCFGKNQNLWVVPSWEDQTQYPAPLIRIDPGVAFGTGTHPTTALCLSYLADNPTTDQSVIDYGCGSGILALAALAMGAKHVFATDHDEMAVDASNHNASLNNFITEKNLSVSHYVPLATKAGDLVIANILANPLIELAKTITNLCKANGRLVLSGLLSIEVDHVLQYYTAFKEIERHHNEDWCAVVLVKSS